MRDLYTNSGRRGRIWQLGSAIRVALLVAWALGSAVEVRASDGEVAPRYLIEAIQIVGAEKTHSSVIRAALAVEVGQHLDVDDRRFETSRYRVLALGFFSEVQLELKKGSTRGYVVLVVRVKERGTILLTDLFLGVSEATAAWGGLGLAEKNFLGRGIGLEGAFVLGADPDVERGSLQQAYWLRASAPRFWGPLEASASFLYLDGSEFFRHSGDESSSRPADFLSVPYRRVGGTVGLGFDPGRLTRLQLDFRAEAVRSDVPAGAVWRQPSGRVELIAFDIARGDSVLSLLSVHLDYDSRSDPVLPERGTLLSVGADMATPLLGSSYSYVKLTANYLRSVPLPWGHGLTLGLLAGVIFGEAPFFEQFFIGDINDLVPGRSLGLNFSTMPSRDFLGTSIDSRRYEELALRATVEYVIPWFRGGRFAYRGDLFFKIGLFFLGSKDQLALRDRGFAEAVPADLTIDAGVRLDTRVGVFRISIGNGLGRIPF